MRFYVYGIVVDSVLRYIGKGSGWRAKQHLSIARRLHRVRQTGQKVKASYFYNKLSKEMARGAVVEIQIIAKGLGEDAAYDLERERIAATEGLWNRWSGGFGSREASPELRKTMSRAALRRYSDPEQRRDLAARISAVAKTPHFRAATASRQKARFAAGDPAMVRFHAQAHRPEVYKKRGETLKKTLADRPDLRNGLAKWRAAHIAEHAETLKAAHARPEVKAKRRAYYDSPEGRANLSRAALAAKAVRQAKRAAAETSAA